MLIENLKIGKLYYFQSTTRNIEFFGPTWYHKYKNSFRASDHGYLLNGVFMFLGNLFVSESEDNDYCKLDWYHFDILLENKKLQALIMVYRKKNKPKIIEFTEHPYHTNFKTNIRRF